DEQTRVDAHGTPLGVDVTPSRRIGQAASAVGEVDPRITAFHAAREAPGKAVAGAAEPRDLDEELDLEGALAARVEGRVGEAEEALAARVLGLVEGLLGAEEARRPAVGVVAQALEPGELGHGRDAPPDLRPHAAPALGVEADPSAAGAPRDDGRAVVAAVRDRADGAGGPRRAAGGALRQRHHR